MGELKVGSPVMAEVTSIWADKIKKANGIMEPGRVTYLHPKGRFATVRFVRGYPSAYTLDKVTQISEKRFEIEAEGALSRGFIDRLMEEKTVWE